MTFEELRGIPLLDGLSDDQLRELMAAGSEPQFAPGDVLFRGGQPADSWWLLLEGRVELLRHVGHEDTVVGAMESPGQWAGGFRAWDPHGVYMATGRAVSPGRMLCVGSEQLAAVAQSWFPFGVHIIRGLVQTVRTIESVARQREALVSLGTLAAGLAHEINNPASAATRAVDALHETCDGLMTSLSRLAESGVTNAEFVQLDALRRELGSTSPDESPLALADREEELSDWLVEHGVGEDWLVAPAFAAAGVDVAWCDRVGSLLGARCLEPAMHWVASSLSTTTLLAEVKEATNRVSSLVGAVRSYSQLDRASVQRTNVTEGLESTLMVLAHKLRGVTVVKEYADGVPVIEANPGELNQVWTNLIDNAIDAMEGSGTLRIAVGRRGDSLVVEIGDTGPGVPEGVLPHVFEPFFTTKDVGRGTGLGLDISRRIVVDRHSGAIDVRRADGETVFEVRLPLAH